jgi:protein-S-isoprenylcysteine O-methyltransferase Ste14
MKSILTYGLALFAGLLIFLGLPMIAWGIGDIPQFFNSPARLTYAIVITLLQVFSIFYNPRAGQNKGESKRGVEKHKTDLLLIQILSLAVVFLAPLSDRNSFGIFNFGETVRLLGFIFLTPGFILMQIAEKYLDRQFSIVVTIQKDHKLIQSGPYKFIRHPRYLGILSFFTGISLVFRSLFAVFLVIALSLVLIWRIYAEEALMKQEFDKEWDAHCKKSWRIIPFVF